MNSVRSLKSVGIMALALLALSISASRASAQEYEGKFTLPFTAHWGQTVLPPGEYSFALNTTVHPFLVTVRGEGHTVIIKAAGTSDPRTDGPSALFAVRSRGVLFVRTLYLKEMGLLLEYSLPGGERQLVAQAPQLIQRVPVIAGGK